MRRLWPFGVLVEVGKLSFSLTAWTVESVYDRSMLSVQLRHVVPNRKKYGLHCFQKVYEGWSEKIIKLIYVLNYETTTAI